MRRRIPRFRTDLPSPVRLARQTWHRRLQDSPTPQRSANRTWLFSKCSWLVPPRDGKVVEIYNALRTLYNLRHCESRGEHYGHRLQTLPGQRERKSFAAEMADARKTFLQLQRALSPTSRKTHRA